MKDSSNLHGEKSRLIAIVGRIIVVIALIYFGYALAKRWSEITSRGITFSESVAVVGLSLLYGGTLYLIAEVWHRILNMLARSYVSRRTTYPSYALTQIAKYLPGNVFHLVGRYIFLARQGVANATLIAASTSEILVLISASLLTIALVSFFIPIHEPDIAEVIQAPIVVFLSALWAAAIGAIWFRSHVRFSAVSLRELSSIVILAALFFLVQGGIFLTHCRLMEPSIGASVAALATAAWLIGFLTPGAPGGVGSREVALLFFIRPVMAEPNAIVAIALFRLVTTLGDLVCYLIAHFVWGRQRAAPKEHK